MKVSDKGFCLSYIIVELKIHKTNYYTAIS